MGLYNCVIKEYSNISPPNNPHIVRYIMKIETIPFGKINKPDEKQFTKCYQIGISCTDILQQSIWRLNDNDLKKVLWEYCRQYFIENFAKGNLPEIIQLDLSNGNAPENCPYNPDRIDCSKNEFQIKISEFQDDFMAIFQAAYHYSRENFYLGLSHTTTLSEELQEQLARKDDTIPVPVEFKSNLIPKSLHSVTNLTAYTDYLDSISNVPEFLTMYAKLYAYLQSLETKYTYKVLGNLLKILLNQKPEGELFDNLHSGYECYSKVVELHNNLSKLGNSFSLFPKWKTFMSRTLRNAIAHNDIYLDSERRTLLIPSLIVKSVINPNNTDTIKMIYSFDEIVNYYKNATNFSEAFKNVISHYVDLGRRY